MRARGLIFNLPLGRRKLRAEWVTGDDQKEAINGHIHRNTFMGSDPSTLFNRLLKLLGWLYYWNTGHKWGI